MRFVEVSAKAGCLGSEGLLRSRHRVVRRQRRTAGWISTSATIRTRISSTSIRRTARSRRSGFPMGVAVSEDGAEQGSMGIALGDYDHSGRFSIHVTNFAEEYNALYRNNGDPFHRRVVPIAHGRGQPAVCRLGERLLRLRQRRLAGSHCRERPRLSAARSRAARRVGGISPAETALSQSAVTGRSKRWPESTARRSPKSA